MAHQVKYAPSKFQHIISRSTWISQGPPARYQLVTKRESLDGEREEESRLRRWTLGERDPSKANKTILLVGETGTGKSTMINALVNYVMGVEMKDKVWFEIVEEKTGRSQSESQTSEVTVYQIFGFEGRRVPYSLTIIDTPGYGDTRGGHQDKIVANKLQALFMSEKGIHQLDSVGFVVQAGVNRLSNRQKYVFESVVDLFGKDMEKNIVVLMTHSDGAPAPNAIQALKVANIKCATENNQPVHFRFNNCLNETITEDNELTIEFGWRINKKAMQGFFKFIGEKAVPRGMNTTLEVLRERIRLSACIQNMNERIELSEKKKTSTEKIKNDLELHKKDIEINKNFTIPVEEVYKVKATISDWWDSKAVTCSVCKENCHYPGCTIATSSWWCEVMTEQNGEMRCTSCTGRCSYQDHVKENFKYVNETKVVTKTVEEMKKKYETKTKLAGQDQSLLSGLEAEMKELRDEQYKLAMEAFECVIKLDAIALNVHSSTIHVHLDFIIKILKANKQQQKARKLEEIQNRKQ